MPPSDDLASHAEDDSDSDMEDLEIEITNVPYMNSIKEEDEESASDDFGDAEDMRIAEQIARIPATESDLEELGDDPFEGIPDFDEPDVDQSREQVEDVGEGLASDSESKRFSAGFKTTSFHRTRNTQRSQQFLGEFQLSKTTPPIFPPMRKGSQ
eukprot:TRINITY_DN1350_c0_g1_i3.p1 TRINITY_DN1350_c0_g1~~TRINITY_DN1350_c0_g1_i3.p1  ORF type:complete len:155 (-),score=41.32 TRINITY_DN1350_c0_g1_i3:497-961(-)